MILGIVTATFFIVEGSLFILNRIGKRISTKKMLTIHCVGGFLTLVVGVIHFATVLHLWKQRPILMNLTGCVILVLIATICFLCLGKSRKRTLRMHKLLALLTLVLLSIHIFVGVTSLSAYQIAVQQIDIQKIDLSLVSDGTYLGQCNVGYIFARVSVTVSDGQIVQIELLEHRNERGANAEKIKNSIISQQDVTVDAISGATNSSNVIKKAVENALASGIH